MRLLLVRHGENIANLTKEFSYRLVDYSLTEKGELQARQTGKHLCGSSIAAIYTSPLKRAIQTASIFAEETGVPFQIVEDFREVNVGQLEERPPTAEAWRTHDNVIDAWIAGRRTVSFPGGENYHDLLRRFRRGIFNLPPALAPAAIVIVGHGGIFGYVLDGLCPGVLPDLHRRQPNHNCSISELEQVESPPAQGNEQSFRLVEWANYAHLTGEAAKLVHAIPREESETASAAPPR